MRAIRKGLNKFLKLIDFYPTTLRFEWSTTKDQLYTSVGGWSSLLIILLIIIAFGYFAQDIVFKEKPKVIVETKKLSPFPNISLTPQNLSFAFSLSTSDGKRVPYDPTIINIYGAEIVWNNRFPNGSINYSSKIHRPKPCTPNNFYPQINANDLPNLTNFYCFDANFSLGGSIADFPFSSFAISVDICTLQFSKIMNITCQNYSDIMSTIIGKQYQYFEIYYTNTLLLLKNASNKYKATKLTLLDMYSFDSQFNKWFYNSLNFLEINADDGYIWSDINKNYTYVDIVQKRTEISIFTNRNKTFIFWILEVGDIKNIQSLSYVKLQEVIAQIGGIFNVIFFGVFLMSFLYIHKKKKEAIVNKFFHIEKQQKFKERLANKRKKTELLQKLENKLFEPNNCTSNQCSSVKNSQDKFLNTQKPGLSKKKIDMENNKIASKSKGIQVLPLLKKNEKNNDNQMIKKTHLEIEIKSNNQKETRSSRRNSCDYLYKNNSQKIISKSNSFCQEKKSQKEKIQDYQKKNKENIQKIKSSVFGKFGDTKAKSKYNESLYNKGITIVSNQLNQQQFLQLSHEFSLLKKILFSKDQQFVFSLISKQNLAQIDRELEFEFQKEKQLNEINRLVNVTKQIDKLMKQKEKIDIIDFRLAEMIDEKYCGWILDSIALENPFSSNSLNHQYQ